MALDNLSALATALEIPKLSVMFKGKPGGGKTAAALSFPGPVLYLQCDPNTQTVWENKRDDMARVKIDSWKTYDKLVRPLLRNREELTLEGKPISTVVVDTWSFMSMMITEDLSGPAGKMQMQDWGMLLNRQKEAILELACLTMNEGQHPGCHVVVTCHTKENTDEEGRIQSVGLALQGQFKDSMEAYFDYSLVCENVARNEVRGGKTHSVREFVIHAAPPPRWTTKGGNLPPKVVVPTGGSAFNELNKTWDL